MKRTSHRLKVNVGCLAISLWYGSLNGATTPVENQAQSTDEWRLTSVSLDVGQGHGLRSPRVEGYASALSVYPGESFEFHLSAAPAAMVDIAIYRTGFYEGKGARLMQRIDGVEVRPQAVPEPVEGRMRECDWPATTRFTIPADWTSGVYLAKLTRADDRNQSYVTFVVKSREPADLLVQCSDFTWQAYNKWPGKDSLYDDGGTRDRFNQYMYTGRETRVSFNRPYAMYAQLQRVPEFIGSGGYLLTEFPLVYWLEQEGYSVAYCSNLDTDLDPAVLERCRVFVSVGHDEYWTPRAARNAAAARDRGVSFAFLSANSILHGVELGAGGSGPARSLRRASSLRAEARELIGASTYGPGYGDWVVTRAGHWIFSGTGLANGDAFEGLVGWEYQGPPLAGSPGLEVIAAGRLDAFWSKQGLEFAATVYPGPMGNWVFNTGTIWWSQALSSPPGHVPGADSEGRTYGVDARVQRITRNFLNRALTDSKLKPAAGVDTLAGK